ncbi:MAG: endolytic transglycosylase MltG [Burkholderiaceae bacterium]
MRRTLIRLLLLALIAIVAFAGWIGYEHHRYETSPVIATGAPVTFDIKKGQGARTLPPTLRGAGVVAADWRLALAWRLRGDSAQVKAGNYQFVGPVTLKALLDELVAGQPARERTVALIEGLTFAQYRAALAKAPGLISATAGLSDREVLERIGSTETHPEGWFAPDSYRYADGSTDIELLTRAHALQKQRLADAWIARVDGLPLATPYDLLTLASIIEKETGHEPDRALVAAVFANRLRRGMMLQSDPTTIYGLGDRFDGNLRRRDLRADTPYNTYVRTGLPPTPIAMPGRASLAVAARPGDSKALFFVSRGDGSSHFSDDLDAHNRAVDRYQRQRPAPTKETQKEVAKEAVRESIKGPGREGIKESGRESSKESGREGTKDSGREGIKDSGRESSKESGGDAAMEGARDAGSDPTIEAAKPSAAK